MGKLTALEVSRNVTRGRYPDGGGLYFVVETATNRHWSYRYSLNGKERWYGLGSVTGTSLAEARLARDAARLRVKNEGVDLVEERKQARTQEKAAVALAASPTFQECAEKYIDENRAGWSGKHGDQWPATLKTYAYPVIGHLRIAEILPSHIFDVLKPIWIDKAETANRVRGRIETIIAKNVDLDDINFRNPAELTKALREKLPKRPSRAVEHHAALPYSEAPAFMQDLRKGYSVAADALALLILTVARTGEVIGARAEEFNVQDAVWTIPADRMKMGVEHRVPLSAPALAIVKDRIAAVGKGYLFPGKNSMLSNMAMLAVLKRMRRTDVTAHGFRATFATWAEECTEYADAIREAALAHKYKNEVMAAYQRGDKIEKRRALMNDWAAFVSPAVGGDNVVQLRA